jgi:hypothetical protein
MQANRPRVQGWLERFGGRYSRGVVAATAAALLALPALGVPLLSAGAERGALYRAMGLLTAASPCAIVLVPLAYVAAIAAVTRRCRLTSWSISRRFQPLHTLISCHTLLAALRGVSSPCTRCLHATLHTSIASRASIASMHARGA